MSIKSLLYLNNFILSFKKKSFLLALLFFISFIGSSQQIANYINNGGFELQYNCNIPVINTVKYWRSIDSSNSSCSFLSTCFPNVPYDGVSFQYPHKGLNYCGATALCQPPQCSVNSNRGYFRNRLKTNLISGKVYCVKFYLNIRDNSSYGIDAIGAYFGDNSLDTITKIAIPLTYLTPQVENPVSNILTDTMNWIPVTGTFVANGTEKNCLIGNFKSDSNTNKVLINSTTLPTIACDILIDDVSCIPIDLPAYAGPDIYGIPTTTVYLGRQRDVGIDEACMWYHLPNITAAIDTAAGITVTVASVTNIYMVKQDICGMIKYDTVVVFASAVGMNEMESIKNNIQLFPNPANDVLNISFNLQRTELFSKFKILNNLSQVIRQEELKNNLIDIKDLSNGVYFLNLISDQLGSVSKKFVIAR